MVLAAIACAVPACFPPDDGRAPPLDQIYFPVGLALSADNNRLYVANSDFDLQYNAGTFQVLDAEAIRDLLPRYCESDADCTSGLVCDLGDAQRPVTRFCVEPGDDNPCGERGVKSPADRLIEPGLCNPIQIQDDPYVQSDLLLDAVVITAFATDAVARRAPSSVDDGYARVFMPTRGDATLHWLDVLDAPNSAGRLIECGQGSKNRCDDAHRVGDDPGESSDGDSELPIEPFAVAATQDGTAVLVSHNSQGRVSLVTNDWSKRTGGLHLSFVLDDLPPRPVGLAAIPKPRLADYLDDRAYQPGFYVTYRSTSQIDLLRYHAEEEQEVDNSVLLERVRSINITVTSGFDSRGIAVSDQTRLACESACEDGSGDESSLVDCLRLCISVPTDVYVANRSPNALLIGQTLITHGDLAGGDVPRLTDEEPLRDGPSRVQLGFVRDERGQPSLRVFIVAFDSRFVYIYDPAAGAVEARIRTGRGPHALAIDNEHGLGFVAHFTDSYIGVVDLDKRSTHYGEIVMTVGDPTAPRASK